ncbi:hypothetical protein [Nonomuraea soli]|uniref:Uncharacterized protein n=1 Tax=Nonomuraea soli TaxID=1032476 RepID=A0A7W0HVZ8_9ACTN|nr:hypothetical protein [Nonomuraea soli]MBA2897326.1 hypothetical protein [Nonomuraea soli]
MDVKPVAGPTKGSKCPKTVLQWDGSALVVTVPGDSVRLRPAGLCLYSHTQESGVLKGLALLDADGMIMLDLPGEWHYRPLRQLAWTAGATFDSSMPAPIPVRLSARAPGWRRLTGRKVARIGRWTRTLILGASIAGLFLMAYIVTVGGFLAWRGLSSLGRFLLDLLDSKWALALFSPVLGVLRPVRGWFHRRKVERGDVLGSYGGVNLTVDTEMLRVSRGKENLPPLRLSRGLWFVLYRYEDLTGLFVIDSANETRRHLPGFWAPEDVNRFALRHDLPLQVVRLTREEYLERVRSAKHATF